VLEQVGAEAGLARSNLLVVLRRNNAGSIRSRWRGQRLGMSKPAIEPPCRDCVHMLKDELFVRSAHRKWCRRRGQRNRQADQDCPRRAVQQSWKRAVRSSKGDATSHCRSHNYAAIVMVAPIAALWPESLPAGLKRISADAATLGLLERG